MIDKKKVFITSDVQEKSRQDVEKKLRRFYEKSDKKFDLVECPDSADIILVGDVRISDPTQKITINSYISNYPDKSFVISHTDRPIILTHGIYSSCEKSIMRINRVRTGSYSLYPDRFRNPFIDSTLALGTNSIQKRFLFSFIGRDVAVPVRRSLFRQDFHRPDIFIEDSSDFNLYENPPDILDRQKHYVDVLSSSKFSLCPRGAGTNSIRLFEAMELGVAPVIISDDWIAPKGPKWDQFSLRIKQKHVKELEKIVSSVEDSYEEMGDMAQKEYERYFSDHAYFNYVVENCLEIQKHQIIPEHIYTRIIPLYLFIIKSKAILTDAVIRRLRLICGLLFDSPPLGRC